MRCLQSGTSELLLEGDRVIRLDWNRNRDLLNLDPLTEQLFNDFPWLVKRVLVPAAHLAGLFARAVLSVSSVAVA